MRYRVPPEQKPNTIPSRNAINLFWHRLYNSISKYQRDECVKTEKSKFELDKFLVLILDEPKMSNYFTAARNNISILDQLSLLIELKDSRICRRNCYETISSIPRK